VALYRLGGDGAREIARWEGDALCAANDLALLDRAVWVTLDRADCPGLSMRDALGLGPGGALLRLEGGERLTVTAGLAFANGLAALGPGRLAVAETRGGRLARLGGLSALPGEAPPAHLAWRERGLALPGGPDNLTRAADGRIVAAVHPSLPRLALYRHGWRDRAPSRIVAVDPETGAVEALFDDPAGALFPGATVGALVEGSLVAGSVRGSGLLLCAGTA
jgi:arylesterase/paraoxonase